jgi:hypothetical protein
MANKRKTHVIGGTPNHHQALPDLNKDLANGWRVLQVHPGASSASNFWLVVLEEVAGKSGIEGI